MSDEKEEVANWEPPTGEQAAAEFAELEAKEAGGTDDTPSPDHVAVEHKTEVPTVDDAQEVTPSLEEKVAYLEAQQARYVEAIAQMQQRQAQPAPAPKPQAPKELTLEELDQLWQKNPMAAMQAAALAHPDMRAMKEQIKRFEQVEEERAERGFADRINAQQKSVETKYPDFKPNSPVYNAAYKFVLDNRNWLRQVAEQNPSFNIVEHAYKQVAFDLRDAIVNAQSKKLVDKRAKSASIKPGGTNPVTPSSGSNARDAASELAQHGEVVPDEWVNAADQAFKRFS